MPSVVQLEGSATRQPPSTSRGVRTRASLVSAARTVFERDGYLDSRLTDITAEANCSTGSFYTYFDNEAIFSAALELAKEDVMHPSIGNVDVADDPRALIEAGNQVLLRGLCAEYKADGLAATGCQYRSEIRRSPSAAQYPVPGTQCTQHCQTAGAGIGRS